MKMFRNFLGSALSAVFLAASLSAAGFLATSCASIGLAPAQSFSDKLAYAYGVHTAVLNTAALSVASKSLSVADARKVLSLADQSRGLLDDAKALSSSGADTATATGKLILATQILEQLQTYLKKPGA